MLWRIRTALTGALSGNDDAAVLSRREMLAGIGLAGACAVAGPALFGSSPAAAREHTPAAEPISDATHTEAAERNPDTEFSSQDWRRRRRRRRRYYRDRRRYYRRRRRRSRIVCRRRWRYGRLVRTCRRVWYRR